MSSQKRPRENNEVTVENLIDTKLYSLITKLEIKKSEYFNFDKIKTEFIKILEKNSEGMMNKCLSCGTDMGRTNPRQLCGKSYCYYKCLDEKSKEETEFYSDSETDVDSIS